MIIKKKELIKGRRERKKNEGKERERKKTRKGEKEREKKHGREGKKERERENNEVRERGTNKKGKESEKDHVGVSLEHFSPNFTTPKLFSIQKCQTT